MGIAAKKKKKTVDNGRGPRKVFPWSSLKRINASFYLPGPEKKNYVYSSLLWYNKKRKIKKQKPIKITMSTEKKGIRVWRIK